MFVGWRMAPGLESGTLKVSPLGWRGGWSVIQPIRLLIYFELRQNSHHVN